MHPDSSLPKGPLPPLTIAGAEARIAQATAHTAVLVEGWSDQAAVETLARRMAVDLAARGIVVLPIGGATNARLFAQHFGPSGRGLRLAGLYDRPEARHFLRAIGGVTGSAFDDTEAARRGFHACDRDLEDELIRALGPAAVERVIAAEGEWSAFCRFQAQPAQRDRPVEAHLRRFMGTRARRKVRYGALLAGALPLDALPAPLERLLLDLRESR
jgi:hypothetical protein